MPLNKKINIMNISLPHAFSYIEASKKIFIDDEIEGEAVTYCLDENPENIFMEISWEEDDTLWITSFKEKDNMGVEINGSQMFFKDEHQQVRTITPYFEVNLENCHKEALKNARKV